MRIGIVGDLHGWFSQLDVRMFNQSGYDLMLFTGDLCRFVNPVETLAVARQIAQLSVPTILISGNHDVVNFLQFFAEIAGREWLGKFAGWGHFRFHKRLREAIRPAVLGGYSTHHFHADGKTLAVIAGRPLAAGGSRLHYWTLLQRCYGVRNYSESVARFKQCVDAADADHLVFLAHNGPWGLGGNPADIWGCDFDPVRGDFGDRDLAEGVAYAQQMNKRVAAVVAGHMHLQSIIGPRYPGRKPVKGAVRPWHIEKDGAHYVNAARVPRVFVHAGKKVRHHICLEISREVVSIQEVLVPE